MSVNQAVRPRKEVTENRQSGSVRAFGEISVGNTDRARMLRQELARCDREVAACVEGMQDGPAWLPLLGHADWKAERELIAAEIRAAIGMERT